jgi:hypothetical protein
MSERAISSTPKRAPSTVTPVCSGLLQRQCGCGQHTIAGQECEECRKDRQGLLQRRSNGGADPRTIPSIVHDVLRAPGSPLDAATRRSLEPRLGHDLSRVRVHADSRAAESAAAVGASAFAFGNDLVFGAGKYSPTTSAGRSLLAHELVHVLQQRRGGAGAPGTAVALSRPGDPAEHEAETLGRRVAAGEPVNVQQPARGLVQGDFGEVLKDVGIGVGLAAAGAGLGYLAYKLFGGSDDATVIDNPPKCGERQVKKIGPTVKQAGLWVGKALTRFRAYVADQKAPANQPVQARVEARFGKGASGRPEVLAKIDRVAGLIGGRLDRRDFEVECHDKKTDNLCGQMAAAYVPGYGSTVVFCPGFFSGDSSELSLELIHELAHSLMGGPARIADRGYRGERITPMLSTEEALTNAESYAEFIVDLAVGTVPSTAPTDVIGKSCPESWGQPIREAIAKAQRWNTNALNSVTGTDVSKMKQADLEAMNVYKKAFDRLRAPVELECQPAGGGQCDKTAVYWTAPNSKLYLCPDWKSKNPDDQAVSLLNAIYGDFAGVAEEPKRAGYAQRAFQITSTEFTVRPKAEIFGSPAWSPDQLNIAFEVRQPVQLYYVESGTAHTRLSADLPAYQGPQCGSSRLPFEFESVFFVDAGGRERPAPFKPPHLAMIGSFKSAVPGAGFEHRQDDPHPIYQGAGIGLKTHFTQPVKWSFDKNGVLGIKITMDDQETGVTRAYDDTLRIEAERPCPPAGAPPAKTGP